MRRVRKALITIDDGGQLILYSHCFGPFSEDPFVPVSLNLLFAGA
jgi:hypothetical protein